MLYTGNCGLYKLVVNVGYINVKYLVRTLKVRYVLEFQNKKLEMEHEIDDIGIGVYLLIYTRFKAIS